MSLLSAFIIFDILIIIYEILISIFSTLYELSGLTKEQARFQVTSLLTGTGFTTTESEKMLATKKRRKVTRMIMMFSYIFNISIISTIVALFTSTQNATLNELLTGLLLSFIVLIIVMFSKKVTRIRNIIDKIFLYVVGKIFYKINNQILIYDYYSDKIVLAEVKLNGVPDKLKDKTLKQIDLENKYNIHILTIRRKNKVIYNINKNTKLFAKDTVLLVGPKKMITSIFK